MMHRRAFLAALAAPGLANLLGTESVAAARSKPKLLLKLPLAPGDSIQGVWRFHDGRVLMTQDPDGNKRRAVMRFTLLTPRGDVERSWDIPYGAHPQSLFVQRQGDAYLVFTNRTGGRGLAVLRLSGDLKELALVTEIVPVTQDGRHLRFSAFGVDPGRDTIICAHGPRPDLRVRYYRFSDFVKGVATPLSATMTVRQSADFQLGFLQGVGTWNGIGYVLTGDNQKNTTKRLLRLAPDGTASATVLNPARKRALWYYEPEALFVQDGMIVFGIYDLFLHRLYTLPAL